MNNLILGSTKIYGCLADPIEHVKAPLIFTNIFREKNIDAVMVPINVSEKNLEKVIIALKSIKNFSGMTITIPHKTNILHMCDFLKPDAERTKAVNWIKFDESRKLIGDNFDGQGFVNGFYKQKHTFENKSVCLVGTGGAGASIAFALAKEKIKQLTLINRDINKANVLKSNINKIFHALEISVFNSSEKILKDYEIVINATSLGLKKSDKIPFNVHETNEKCIIADIIMNPIETDLLIKAKSIGRTIHYGKHMIETQIQLAGNFLKLW